MYRFLYNFKDGYKHYRYYVDEQNCAVFFQEVYIYPKFDSSKVASNHDIAILRLDKTVPIGHSEIKPICLPLSKRFVR